METGLLVTDEQNRANKFISSVLFSRATIFHPAYRLTQKMKKRLLEVLNSGGTNPNKPLASVLIHSYGKKFRIDLHVDYLLHPHRDILEMILAYAKTIIIDDESYEIGGRLSWTQILATLPNAKMSAAQPDGFDSFIDRDATVFSISMYELATRLKIQPTRKNYQQIEQRIMQLSSAKLIINEMDLNGNIVEKKLLSFIHDFRFCFDKSKVKNGVGLDKCLTNHLFIVPDIRLIEAITSHGYYYRLEQHKITNYDSLATRSFIKWMTTHKLTYLHTKRLNWAINEYISSIAMPVSASFRSELRKSVISNAYQIEKDFDLQIRTQNEKEEQIFYVGAEL